MFSRCDPMIINSTISQNIASESGGALYCTNDSEPIVQNSILWNNEAPLGPELHVAFFNLPSLLTIGHIPGPRGRREKPASEKDELDDLIDELDELEL